MALAENLIWLDLEMTGLDPWDDHIIEMATIITDGELNVLAEGPVLAIYQPDDVLASMSDWCQKHHGASGLIERVRHQSVSCAEAEQQTLAFVQQWTQEGVSPMCGNTIGHDRRFLSREMPTLTNWFHYRNIDVSTIKELARRWYPQINATHHKQAAHLALDDIRESIEELRYYRSTIFVPTQSSAC